MTQYCALCIGPVHEFLRMAVSASNNAAIVPYASTINYEESKR
jgi:hypothetical protein